MRSHTRALVPILPVLVAALLAAQTAQAGSADRRLQRAPNPRLSAACFTVERDLDCGSNQIGPGVTCADSEGNAGDTCILLETIAAPTYRCAQTQSRGSTRCELATQQVCATRIERWCDDGICMQQISAQPCCSTHALTGLACNPSDTIAE